MVGPIEGLKRRHELEPFVIEGPLFLDLTYKNDKAAELIAYLPSVELIDNHTVRAQLDLRRVFQESCDRDEGLLYRATLRCVITNGAKGSVGLGQQHVRTDAFEAH
jgi:hypothetical protein